MCDNFIPPGWDNVRIAQLGEIVSGGTPSTTVPGYWDGVIPWVTPSDVTSLHAKIITESKKKITSQGLSSSSAKLLPIGSLLVTTRATIGACCLAGKPLTTNQGFKSIIPEDKTYLDFYYHYLTNSVRNLEKRAIGSTFKEISKQEFENIYVLHPPKSEQIAIAAILDTVDEAIRRSEVLIAKLRQVKAGMLHDLLTRGLDENGELRDPIRHPEQFKDSLLGRIPAAWDICPLMAFATLQRGFDITVAEQKTGNIPVVSSSGITSYHNKAAVSGPGVVIGRKGKLGGAYFLEGPFWPHDTSLWVKNFHGNDEKFAAIFLKFLRLERFDAATSVPTLNRNAIHPILIGIPGKSEQISIVKHIEKNEKTVRMEATFLNKLITIKQGLMQDLLTGRVRVPEAMLPKYQTEVAAA